MQIKRYVSLLFVLALIGPCRADSLFPIGNAASPAGVGGVSLFSDDKAHRVGDILTIIINENATAASQAATKTSKNDTFNYGPGTGPTAINLGPIHFGLGSIPALGLGGGIGSTASGTTSRSDNLSGEIEVVVKQILPNGNLSVEGTRQVGMNAEVQTITLTGVIRPEDISAADTVESPQVADAQIKYGGKGPVGDKQRDNGILNRVFKILF
jgi:flagellar L-ring protein precursor FlgH